MEEYDTWVDNLCTLVELEDRDVVTAGDFNAKASEWGSPIEDRRGQVLVEACARLRMITANKGGKPTFERGSSKSHIDITFISENIANKLKSCRKQNKKNTFKGKISLNKRLYKRDLEIELNKIGTRNLNPSETTKLVRIAYQKSKETTRTSPHSAPYWWNEQMAEQRRNCNSARRHYTRLLQRNTNEEDGEEVRQLYKAARKQLRNMTREEKRKQWQNVCEEVNNDVFGNGYQIVMKRFNITNKHRVHLSNSQKRCTRK